MKKLLYLGALMILLSATPVVKKPPLMHVGISCRTSNAPDAAPIDIPRVWDKFFREDILNKIPHKASNELVVVYCDYESDYTQPYTYILGCLTTSLDDIPEGMVATSIPAASYNVYQAKGEQPKSLVETWMKIWQSPPKRTYTYDLEIYDDRYFAQQPQEIDVYIGVIP